MNLLQKLNLTCFLIFDVSRTPVYRSWISTLSSSKPFGIFALFGRMQRTKNGSAWIIFAISDRREFYKWIQHQWINVNNIDTLHWFWQNKWRIAWFSYLTYTLSNNNILEELKHSLFKNLRFNALKSLIEKNQIIMGGNFSILN